MNRAVVFAYHNVGVRCLKALLAGGVEVALVVTQPDNPAEHIWFASVADTAGEYGLPCLAPDDPNLPAVLEQVRALRPDFLFSFYCRSLLRASLLDCAGRGAYNMHGSLLPKYRGRVPVNWAVLHGERETGATLHQMTARPDAGAIVDQQAVPILPDDSAREVFDKVTVAAEMVLVRSLPALLDGNAVLRGQQPGEGSYFGGRQPQDGLIDWSQSARAIHNLVRAVTRPFPGAFTDVPAGRLWVWKTQVVTDSGTSAVPRLLSEADGLYVCCRSGVLRLLDAELNGQRFDAARFRELGAQVGLSA